MKAYQFNEETGLYEGEIFADSATLDYVGGITTVVPPEFGSGEVPVFEATGQQWTVLPVSVARQLLLGRNQ
jgi:hypothetical protein